MDPPPRSAKPTNNITYTVLSILKCFFRPWWSPRLSNKLIHLFLCFCYDIIDINYLIYKVSNSQLWIVECWELWSKVNTSAQQEILSVSVGGDTVCSVQCGAVKCSAFHCWTVHCTAFYCTALNCTALHCTVGIGDRVRLCLFSQQQEADGREVGQE